MFKNQAIKATSTQNKALQLAQIPHTRRTICPLGDPARLLNTHTSRLAAAFVTTLQVTDVRHAVTYYGPFLREIPQRLGSSPVLDSAVKAVTTAYPFLRTRGFPPTALAHYGQSLRALRDCLNNPSEARTPHTLCAVYLIIVCQVSLSNFLGLDGTLLG